MIWKFAIEEEFKERLVFVSQDSLAVMPTRNNISSILGVNRKIRAWARKHYYNFKIPVFLMPRLKAQDLAPIMNSGDWLVKTANVRFGPNSNPRWMHGSRTGFKRYWHHYAMHELGEATKNLIEQTRPNNGSRRGYIFLNAQRDRFVLSYQTDNSDMVDNIVDQADCDGEGVLYHTPYPDSLAYQMTLD